MLSMYYPTWFTHFSTALLLALPSAQSRGHSPSSALLLPKHWHTFNHAIRPFSKRYCYVWAAIPFFQSAMQHICAPCCPRSKRTGVLELFHVFVMWLNLCVKWSWHVDGGTHMADVMWPIDAGAEWSRNQHGCLYGHVMDVKPLYKSRTPTRRNVRFSLQVFCVKRNSWVDGEPQQTSCLIFCRKNSVILRSSAVLFWGAVQCYFEEQCSVILKLISVLVHVVIVK